MRNKCLYIVESIYILNKMFLSYNWDCLIANFRELLEMWYQYFFISYNFRKEFDRVTWLKNIFISPFYFISVKYIMTHHVHVLYSNWIRTGLLLFVHLMIIDRLAYYISLIVFNDLKYLWLQFVKSYLIGLYFYLIYICITLPWMIDT